MQHVDLCVDNLYPKIHEILIKNKKVLEPYRIDMNGFIETGSAGTGSWQVEILITLLIAIKVWENFASSVYGFLQNQPEIMSRKKKE